MGERVVAGRMFDDHLRAFAIEDERDTAVFEIVQQSNVLGQARPRRIPVSLLELPQLRPSVKKIRAVDEEVFFERHMRNEFRTRAVAMFFRSGSQACLQEKTERKEQRF